MDYPNSRPSAKEATMTSQEMLDRSHSWTLACDNALLNRLKAFSENLTQNSQELSKECDSMSKDVSRLNYKLMNVTNEFLMLSNTQFVENRVEEFEEFSASLASSNSSAVTNSKTKAEAEAELMSKMKQAIQLGLAACNERRAEDGILSSRFKMKQPHLIGSPKFFSSRYCGLVDENRRFVPLEQVHEPDSMSLSSTSDIMKPEPETKPVVTFTMPPPTVFPPQISTSNINQPHSILENDNRTFTHNEYDKIHQGKFVAPSSPSISDSSEFDNRAASLAGDTVPKSVTDELNKIYSSFAPPPAIGPIDDDSDDDFRPTSTGGRLFDDDDDLFGEKELFPSGQNNRDFFERSNPMKLPTPVFSAPPPTKQQHLPKPQANAKFGDSQTLVGDQPKVSDIPNKSSATDDGSKEEAVIRDDSKPVPEVRGPIRPKLPPGAVSMFGGLPPPVFNNRTIQEVQSGKSIISHVVENPQTQDSKINSASSVGAGNPVVVGRDNGLLSSQKDVNTSVNPASQPSLVASAAARAESISQGPLSGSGISNRTSKKIPVASLFANDSSDEDIFSSSKKPITSVNVPKSVVSQNEHPSMKKNPTVNVPSSIRSSRNQEEQKYKVKKSIFDDSDSDDDLFSTSSKPLANAAYKSSSNSSVSIKNEPHTTKVPVKNSKRSSLFGEDSDSDTDLFGNKKLGNTTTSQTVTKMESVSVSARQENDVAKDVLPVKCDINVAITSEGLSEMSKPDKVDTTEGVIEKEKVLASDKDDALPQVKLTVKTSNSVGSKISEKIKAMENSKLKMSKPDIESNNNDNELNSNNSKTSKPLKSKVSVKTLALTLNINPLAMKVGAKPPKPSTSTSNPSTPDTEPNSNHVSPTKDILPSDTSVKVEEEISPLSIDIMDGESVNETQARPTESPHITGDHFVDIIKTRPRIQKKRRPPSRVFLKSLAVAASEEVEVTGSNVKDEFDLGNERTDETARNTEETAANNKNNEETAAKNNEEIRPTSNEEIKPTSNEEITPTSNEEITSNETFGDEGNEQEGALVSGEDTPRGDIESLENLDSLIASDNHDKQQSSEPTINDSETLPTQKKKHAQNAKQYRSIFGDSDSDDDLFSSKAKDAKTTNNNNDSLFSSKAKAKQKPAASGLFGDDSESDSDLFKSTKPNKEKDLKANSQTGGTVKVFGEKASFFDSSDEN